MPGLRKRRGRSGLKSKRKAERTGSRSANGYSLPQALLLFFVILQICTFLSLCSVSSGLQRKVLRSSQTEQIILKEAVEFASLCAYWKRCALQTETIKHFEADEESVTLSDQGTFILIERQTINRTTSSRIYYSDQGISSYEWQ